MNAIRGFGKDQARLLGLLFFIVLTAYLSSRGFLSLRNTLYRNGRWVVSKTLLEKSVCGGFGFLGSRNSLARQYLNLGRWHGFQEVLYRDSINPREIEFDFLLKDNAYLSFIFNKNKEGFAGIRISRNSLFSDKFFFCNEKGEFKYGEELKDIKTQPESWGHFKMAFGDEDVSLWLNKAFIGRFKVSLRQEQFIGFRSGQEEVFIDDIVIKLKDSDVIIREAFGNENLKAFFLFLLLLLSSTAGLFLVARITRKVAVPIFMSYLNSFYIVSAMALLVFLLFDYFYFSSRYPNRDVFDNSMHGKFLMAEKKYWEKASQEFVVRNIQNMAENQEIGDPFKILFIGTSQTWGAGASRDSEAFISLLERKLNAAEGEGVRYKCINAGISGVDSSRLLDLYLKEWIDLHPQMVVINLSNNDSDHDIFASNLERFIRVNNLRNIKTIFVLEANSIESAWEGRLSPHRTMKQVGEREGITTIDLHGYLLENYDRGFVWWDYVHLTDFGHELTASYLYEKIKIQVRAFH
ncbi:MAG: SGNH/GDSL hydrolase family protein [Candidatus Omnitrophica bacterium]|nr:SGNH/GDSL hydrolase family protein [Candidatus Omnitrophota bacterium]